MNRFLFFVFVQTLTVLQAGRCVPPLMEGDQVLLINGRDISEHTHQQVVMFIKASRESHSKELALLVRRKGTTFVDVHVYKCDLRGIHWFSLSIDAFSWYIRSENASNVYLQVSLCELNPRYN